MHLQRVFTSVRAVCALPSRGRPNLRRHCQCYLSIFRAPMCCLESGPGQTAALRCRCINTQLAEVQVPGQQQHHAVCAACYYLYGRGVHRCRGGATPGWRRTDDTDEGRAWHNRQSEAVLSNMLEASTTASLNILQLHPHGTQHPRVPGGQLGKEPQTPPSDSNFKLTVLQEQTFSVRPQQNG